MVTFESGSVELCQRTVFFAGLVPDRSGWYVGNTGWEIEGRKSTIFAIGTVIVKPSQYASCQNWRSSIRYDVAKPRKK